MEVRSSVGGVKGRSGWWSELGVGKWGACGQSEDYFENSMKWIDRAEARFGHLAISYLVQGIALLCGFSFMLSLFSKDFFELLSLDPQLVMQGQIWRLVTYLFVPNIFSLLPFPHWLNAVFFVVFMIWMGNGLEQAWGAFRLNLFCLVTMVGITVAAFFFGATYAQFMFTQALFFAFARFYPDTEISLYFVLQVKVKWMAWLSAAWICWRFTFAGGSYRCSVLAIFASYLLFFGKDIWEEFWLRRTVAARREKFDQALAVEGTLHECRVCGRTELSGADLEFRVAGDGEEYCGEHLPKAKLGGDL